METLARPRQPSSAKSRSSILKAAEKLFAERGFHATTLKQISEKSRANGALVSYYFGNKEGLREAVIERKLASLEQILGPLASETPSLSDTVRGLFRHVREDASFHRLALRAVLEDGALKKDMSDRLWGPLFERLTEIVEKSSALPREEAEVRCLLLCGLIHQYANMYCFHRAEMKTKRAPESVLAAYEDYVADCIVKEICRA